MQPLVIQKHPLRKSMRYVLLVILVLLFSLLLARSDVNFDFIGWSHGFNHPLDGWDHLLTMLAVGIWAAQMRGKAIWLLPLAFVSVMSIGGLAGATGISIPNAEGIILLSCAVFGILITRKIAFNNKFNVLIVAFFAFFHGFAHGQEISTSASLLSYTIGFMLATLLLHGAGILVAKLVVITCAFLFSLLFSSQAAAFHAEKATKTNAFNRTHNSSQMSLYAVALAIDDFSLSIAQHPSDTINAKQQNSNLNWCALNTGQAKIALFSSTRQHHNKPQQLAVGLLLPNFNDYYPDINSTPGISMLSNGVGLTSPPLALARNLPLHLSNTPSPPLLLSITHFQYSFAPVFWPSTHQLQIVALNHCAPSCTTLFSPAVHFSHFQHISALNIATASNAGPDPPSYLIQSMSYLLS